MVFLTVYRVFDGKKSFFERVWAVLQRLQEVSARQCYFTNDVIYHVSTCISQMLLSTTYLRVRAVRITTTLIVLLHLHSSSLL